MILAVQHALRRETQVRGAAGALAWLETEYAVKAKRHPRFPNLVQLRYDQIGSPFGEELVRDCRGLILDSTDDWRVVCMTYRKFFNHGESHAAPIDWATAQVYEKLDGSLIQVYHYANDWHVATSGTPDGDTPVGDFGKTFAGLFWTTCHENGHGQRAHFDPECCYAFELCTPWNRVVVRYPRPEVWLHGVRRLNILQEEDPGRHALALGFPLAPTFSSLDGFAAVAAAANARDPLAHEGYVVVDGAYNRVKIKSPAYLTLHHAKGVEDVAPPPQE